MLDKIDLLNGPKEKLFENLLQQGWEKYRLKQLDEWLWKHAIRDIEAMSNLSKVQRSYLNEHYFIPSLTESKIQTSLDGTIKFRFKLFDGPFIESVLIPVPEENRFTVCVSSQAGCSLSCAFCATGQMGLLRQLSASEIFDQYVLVNKNVWKFMGNPLVI